MSDAQGFETSDAAPERDPRQDPLLVAKRRLLDAALPNVPFDGWSDAMFRQAAEDADVEAAVAKLAFPRGAVDLALFLHQEGDRAMVEALAGADLSHLRFRDRVAHAVRLRLELLEDRREAVRKAAALFALPVHAADGARAMWGTADKIWTALGDTSDDLNWYSKRAILTGVYSATALYWLGDESEGRVRSWAFLDRRIEGVMRFEKLKSRVNDNPLGRLLLTIPNRVAARVKKPGAVDTGAPVGLPGRP